MFFFGKKRKNFQSNAMRRRVSLGYQRNAGRGRSFKYRLAPIKAAFFRLLVFSAAAGLVYLFLFSPVFAVKNISVSGNHGIKNEEIESLVASLIDHKVFRIFTNNLFLIKTSDIESKTKAQFNSINDIRVTKKFPGTLAVLITEKPVDISWCNRIAIEKINRPGDAGISNPENPALATSQCYFSDDGNVIYQKTKNETSGSAVKVFTDETINIGMKITDDAVRDFIRELSAKFNSKTGLSLAYLYMPPVSSREIRLVTSDGWQAYFDLNRGIDGQLDVLNSTLKNVIPEEDRQKLDYINLTVIDRVYYKTK